MANDEINGNIHLSCALALVGFLGRKIRCYQRYPYIIYSFRVHLTGGICQAVDFEISGVCLLVLVFLRFLMISSLARFRACIVLAS